MSGRMELQPLTEVEEQVLAALCGLEDTGKDPTGLAAADRTGRHHTTVYKTINRLEKKGWIVRDAEARGIRNPVRVAARPGNIESRFGYTPAQPEIDDHRHPEDKPKMRTCLRCGSRFLSEGFGNRKCKPCKSSNVTDMSWMGEVEAWKP